MAPCELGYSIDGVDKGKVVAEDGVTAKLDTPAGTAFAKLEEQGNYWFNKAPVADRLGVSFPGDPEYVLYSTRGDGLHYRINSIFDPLVPNIRRLIKRKRVARVRAYSTEEGVVEIRAVGYDQE